MDITTPLTLAEAAAIATWRYPPPYDIYDGRAGDDLTGYLAIHDGSDLVGFHCIGDDARVPGGCYDDAYVDLGMGLRPDWTGRGRGAAILAAIVAYRGGHLRGTIAAFNVRALRACEHVGFCVVDRFVSPPTGREFVIVTSTRASSAG
jgi:GNAT superfamily N-acetyltransferase